MSPGFSFWYKKASDEKNKVFVAWNLTDCLPNLPGKKKKNQSFFITTILCFPEYSTSPINPVYERRVDSSTLVIQHMLGIL